MSDDAGEFQEADLRPVSPKAVWATPKLTPARVAMKTENGRDPADAEIISGTGSYFEKVGS